jgi:hypothetical protein
LVSDGAERFLKSETSSVAILGRFRLYGDYSYSDFYQKYFVKKIGVVQKCLNLPFINNVPCRK